MEGGGQAAQRKRKRMLQRAKRAKGNGNCNCQSLQANNVAQGQLATPSQRTRPSCNWQSKRVLCAKGRTKRGCPRRLGGGGRWTNGKNAIKRTPRKLCVGVAQQVQCQKRRHSAVQKCFGHFEGTKDKAWQHYTMR